MVHWLQHMWQLTYNSAMRQMFMVVQVLLVEQGRVDPLRGTANARPQQVCSSVHASHWPARALAISTMHWRIYTAQHGKAHANEMVSATLSLCDRAFG